MSQIEGAERGSVFWNQEMVAFALRCALGALFVYMGLTKALHPVDFLKVLREYHITDNSVSLNLIASVLPWFEVVCGLFLLSGVAVRGASLVSVAMLVPFTIAILHRALAVHQAKPGPFCAIRFDCGCGAGEVVVCHKLLENTFLILVSGFLVFAPPRRWLLRPTFLAGGPSGKAKS